MGKIWVREYFCVPGTKYFRPFMCATILLASILHTSCIHCCLHPDCILPTFLPATCPYPVCSLPASCQLFAYRAGLLLVHIIARILSTFLPASYLHLASILPTLFLPAHMLCCLHPVLILPVVCPSSKFFLSLLSHSFFHISFFSLIHTYPQDLSHAREQFQTLSGTLAKFSPPTPLVSGRLMI